MNPFPLTTEFFSFLHEEWMDDEDKIEFDKVLLKRLNTTRKDFECRLKSCLDEGRTIENLAAAVKMESILTRC